MSKYNFNPTPEQLADPNALKRCPCGQVPNDIDWREDFDNKGYIGTPDCCNTWEFFFISDAGERASVIDADAKKGWQELPRGFE